MNKIHDLVVFCEDTGLLKPMCLDIKYEYGVGEAVK